jgi:YHS domain-containing protein
MEGVLTLLVFAGVFYLMMRFGCGAHRVHGHGEGGAQATGRDPVCGMSVPTDQGYAKVHRGTAYRFCSRKCLDQFDADPERYLK